MWVRKSVTPDPNSQGSTPPSWSHVARGYEGGKRAELWAKGRGVEARNGWTIVHAPTPQSEDRSRAVPLTEDV